MSAELDKISNHSDTRIYRRGFKPSFGLPKLCLCFHSLCCLYHNILMLRMMFSHVLRGLCEQHCKTNRLGELKFPWHEVSTMHHIWLTIQQPWIRSSEVLDFTFRNLIHISSVLWINRCLWGSLIILVQFTPLFFWESIFTNFKKTLHVQYISNLLKSFFLNWSLPGEPLAKIKFISSNSFFLNTRNWTLVHSKCNNRQLVSTNFCSIKE